MLRRVDANGRLTLTDWKKICSISSVGRVSSRDSLGLAGVIIAILERHVRGVLIYELDCSGTKEMPSFEFAGGWGSYGGQG